MVSGLTRRLRLAEVNRLMNAQSGRSFVLCVDTDYWYPFCFVVRKSHVIIVLEVFRYRKHSTSN